jgi:transketolase
MFAAHHKVDNLIATVDWNGQQIDGPNDKVISLGDLHAKWSAFGWHVLTMNGNVLDEVLATLAEAKNATGKGKPVMILMHTVMGKGVDFMENDYNWHGVPPSKEQAQKALSQLSETLGDFPHSENI